MLASRIVNVPLDDPFDVPRLLHRLREIDEQDLAAALAEWAVAHIALDAPSAVAWLLEVLHEMRAQEQVDVLLARNPAAHAALDDPFAVATLLDKLREIATQEPAVTLAERAAARVP